MTLWSYVSAPRRGFRETVSLDEHRLFAVVLLGKMVMCPGPPQWTVRLYFFISF